MTRAGHRTISVPEALYDRVAALAEELDLTVPQITRRALNSYLAAAAAAHAAAELNPKEPTS